MCKFTGAGSLTLGGQYGRVHDVEFSNSGGLILSGSIQKARSIVGAVQVTGVLSSIYESDLTTVNWDGDRGELEGCTVYTILDTDANYFRLADCLFASGSQGASITGDHAVVVGNLFYQVGNGDTANTYDCLALAGDASFVAANKFIPDAAVTKSAINIASGTGNIIANNDLGDSTDYATSAIIDSGTGTVLLNWNTAAGYWDIGDTAVLTGQLFIDTTLQHLNLRETDGADYPNDVFLLDINGEIGRLIWYDGSAATFYPMAYFYGHEHATKAHDIEFVDSSGAVIGHWDDSAGTWTFTIPWKTWTPTLSNITQGSGTVIARYVQVGKLVTCYFAFKMGAGSAMGTTPAFTLPVAAASTYTTLDPLGVCSILDFGTNVYKGNIRWNSTTQVVLDYWAVTGSLIRTLAISSTAPMTWATNDSIVAQFSYEAA